MAIQFHLFITKEDMQSWGSEVSDNLDQKMWNGIARNIQLQEIEMRLGEPLYNQLYANAVNNTLTPADLALLDKIKPAQVYYVLARLLYANQYRIEGQGVLTNEVDYTIATDKAILDRQANKYKEDAVFYAEALTKFLNDNHLDYPLYPYKNCKQVNNELNSDLDFGFGAC